jgi:hypothetical protein
VPKRARDRRVTSVDQLAARVDALAQRGCPRLVHLFVPGGSRPSTTPGCVHCAELQRVYDATPPPPPPRAMVTDAAQLDELEGA